jgi:peptide chain release factor
MNRYLQITAGRGPAECARVVTRVLQLLIDDAHSRGLMVTLDDVIYGNDKESIDTAEITLHSDDSLDSFIHTWQGTILWVEKSEIRHHHKRKNWYIAVIEITREVEAQIDDNDIVYQAIRSSGAGGQHVNKVSSAIRATHLPTGHQVLVMDHRSQLMNKRLAYDRLVVKIQNNTSITERATEKSQWKNKIEIQRGNPVRTFYADKIKVSKKRF